jgi:hypothetical protein
MDCLVTRDADPCSVKFFMCEFCVVFMHWFPTPLGEEINDDDDDE